MISSTLNIYRQHVFLVGNNPEIPKKKENFNRQHNTSVGLTKRPSFKAPIAQTTIFTSKLPPVSGVDASPTGTSSARISKTRFCALN